MKKNTLSPKHARSKPIRYTMFKNKNFIDSFNHAINGLRYTFGNERNFRFHIIAAIAVFLVSFFMDFEKIELMILSVTISFVIMAELFNTAVEGVVNTFTKIYHPKAKVIKDVSAAAVLMSTLNAIAVAYILFVERLETGLDLVIDRFSRYPMHILLFSIFLTVGVVILLKLLYNKGTPFKGGMPSGHTAVAFAISTTIVLWFRDATLLIFCFALSFLVAQSRVEGKIHSLLEVIAGALVGILVTLFVYSVVWYSFN